MVCSPDGYVRIPTTELPTIRLQHSESRIDPSVAVLDELFCAKTVAGYTEWTGVWRGQTLSVGWDWAVTHSTIVLLNPREIRTNILLVSASGRAEPTALASIHFLHWIDSMPSWQAPINDLLSGENCPRQ